MANVHARTTRQERGLIYGVGMSQEEGIEAELPLESVGTRLARAREAAGMSLRDLASVTRISVHHLTAIEAGNFAALPGRTYAVGFSRSYGKALGLDPEEIAAQVRATLAGREADLADRSLPAFEPGDPARVPSARLAWLAALGGAVLVLVGLVLWKGFYAPAGSLPTILRDAVAPPPAAPSKPAAKPAVPSGPVVFTALDADIWVKFYDAGGNQLMQKQMALGESWTVPADQEQVLLWTGRPDALAITIGGQAVPKLSETQRTMRDVPVTAAALLARGSAASMPESAASVPQGAAPAAAAPARSPENSTRRNSVRHRPAGAAPIAPQAQPAATPSTPSSEQSST